MFCASKDRPGENIARSEIVKFNELIFLGYLPIAYKHLKLHIMSAIILFDGVCNFCNGSVNFIIDRDPAGYFKFAPLQSEIGAKLLTENGVDTSLTDSVVLIEDGKVYTHSTAALRIAGRLNGAWSYFRHLTVVPSFIRDGFYKLFAKYRYAMFGKQEACMLPTPEVRSRFLATN
jgi:predicted DCC family thiol-disulfide oxidoreductase YuxK